MSTHARLYMSLSVDKGNKKIVGDVMDKEYPFLIEIEGWDWRLSRPEVDSGGAKGTSNTDGQRTKAGEFNFSKRMDRASTQMLSLLQSGEELTAVVSLVQSTDVAFKLVVTMKQVTICSYSLNAKDGEKSTEIEEDWAFRYRLITIEHQPEKRNATTATETLSNNVRSGRVAPTANSMTAATLSKLNCRP